MKKKLCALLSVLFLFQTINVSAVRVKEDSSSGTIDTGPFYSVLSTENWNRKHEKTIQVEHSDISYTAQNENEGIVLTSESRLSFKTQVNESGRYHIMLEYSVPEDSDATDITFNILNKEDVIVQIPVLWHDAQRYAQDRKGNDVTPHQEVVKENFKSFLLLSADIAHNEAVWDLKTNDIYEFEIYNSSHEIEIENIFLCLSETEKNYDQVIKSDLKPVDVDLIVIEGEKYSLKSDSYIRGTAIRKPALVPYDTYKNKINVLDGATWGTPGQKIIWEFDVLTDGYYKIGMRCQQSSDTNKTVFRKVEIDGKTPYREWNAVSIPFTDSVNFKNFTINSSGQDDLIYLQKGKHTISMTVALGEYEEIYHNISELMNDINTLGTDLMKLTAGSSDENRTWDMNEYMPYATQDIENFAMRIDEIYNALERVDGVTPSYASDLTFASDKLRKLLKTPEKIPNRTADLCRGDSSATKFLGNLLSKLSSQPLSIDRIYIYGNKELPAEKTSFWTSLLESVKRFFHSFLPDATANDYSINNDDDDELKVWVGQSTLVVGTLQQMVDEQYNNKYSTNIKLSVMTNDQKLVLSNAAGTNPDVVLSTGAGTPFTFAIRGALKNLLDYEDFLDYYNSEYQLESLISTAYGDGVYGAIDSRNFQLLFYRKDILEMLDVDVPNTWDDVRKIMPVLLRNSMNFYLPLSSSASLKGLGITSPFIFQNGGEIYSQGGTKTGITSDSSKKAITEMTEMYKIYGMQTSVPSFYNSFRYGEIPIGVGDFNLYLQLSVAAPELAGLWGAALTPGTLQSDGSVLRYFPANNTASMIFGNTQKSEEAWRFLKWWLDDETQFDYSQRRRISFGLEYQWNTANIKAFSRFPMDAKTKKLVMEQWESQCEVTPHPAAYIVERELSGVWNGTVVDNKSMIELLDSAAITSNREITRKLTEFGYLDSNGDIVKDYNIHILDALRSKLKGEE